MLEITLKKAILQTAAIHKTNGIDPDVCIFQKNLNN